MDTEECAFLILKKDINLGKMIQNRLKIKSLKFGIKTILNSEKKVQKNGISEICNLAINEWMHNSNFEFEMKRKQK